MSKDEKMLENMLKAEEAIVKQWTGVLCSRISTVVKAEKVNKGIFAITNQRVVFCSDGIFSTVFEDMDLEAVNSVQIHSGFMNSSLTIEGKSLNSLKLVSMTKDQMFDVKKHIGK